MTFIVPPLTPATRTVYVDKFLTGSTLSPYELIGGNSTKEDSLIQFAVDESIDGFYLYDCNLIRSGSAYTTPGKALLANFIAKCSLESIQVGVSHSGSSATVNAIVDYNSGQPANKQIKRLVFEDEYWNGGSYLTFIANLIAARAALNAIGVEVDVYLGWPASSAQIIEIYNNCDRLLLHDYRINPQFAYTRSRVYDLAIEGAIGSFYPIHSVETTNNNGPGVISTSYNFSGFWLEGKNSSGVVVGPRRLINDLWTTYCHNGISGSPIDYVSESNATIRDNIGPGGEVIFAQSLLRRLNYEPATPVVGPAPIVSPVGPIQICPGGSVVLTSDQPLTGGDAWSNAATTQSITVSAAGSYSVTVGGQTSNVVVVTVATPNTPSVTISGSVTPSSPTQVLTFSSSVSGYAGTTYYAWFVNNINVGINTPTFSSVFNNGDIIRCDVKGSNPCDSWFSSNELEIAWPASPGIPTTSPAGIVTMPQAGTMLVTATGTGSNFIWSNGSTNNPLTLTLPGNYYVQEIDSFGQLSPPSLTLTVLPYYNSNVPIPPLPRVGEDASRGSAENEQTPEFISSIELRNDNPYSIGKLTNYLTGFTTLNRPRLRYKATDNDQYYVVRDEDTDRKSVV